MHDLIIGAASVAAGLSGMIAAGYVHRKLPEWNKRDAQLARMGRLELQAECTRCAGAIMTCADSGDRRGMRHAHRAMRPVMRALAKRKTVHVAAQTVFEGDESESDSP